VAPGAFGADRPRLDLFLSPDHAAYAEEVLIPVKHLINGSTIVQVRVDRVAYRHLELAEHDVFLAKGLPAESFLDMRDGSNYADRARPVRLYADFSVGMRDAFGCMRLVVTGPEPEAARAVVERFATDQAAGCIGRSRESTGRRTLYIDSMKPHLLLGSVPGSMGRVWIRRDRSRSMESLY
jgi:hypothetical protein